MTALQKIVLGTPPAAVDGDPVRTASTKANANVDVLNAQIPLTSFATTLTAGQALTAANHLGKRVNINVATAQTFQMPSAASCGADGVILLRNQGTVAVTLAIATGSGDNLGMGTLNGLESALFDTDGVHAWGVLVRGRGTSVNETVVNNLGVGGGLTVTGAAVVGGGAAVTGAITATGPVSASSLEIGSTTVAGGAFLDLHSSGSANDYDGRIVSTGGTAGTSGQGTIQYFGANHTFSVRPTWGSTPWDNNNLGQPMTLNTGQTITANKSYSAQSSWSNTPGGTFSTANVFISPVSSTPGQIGFGANNSAAGGVLGFNAAGSFAFYNFNTSGFAPLTVSTLTQSSDAALKTDVSGYAPVMPRLRGKRIVYYTLKQDASKSVHAGVIAQEWQKDFPELVEETSMDIDEDGDGIAHQFAPVVPVLDAEGNETGEFTGGEEIFGANGKPESRKALGFKYSNASAAALQGLIETDATLQGALDLIASLQARLSALESK